METVQIEGGRRIVRNIEYFNLNMKYKVEIIETLSRTVEVEAESRREAEDVVREKYGREEIVLGADDHIGTEMEVV